MRREFLAATALGSATFISAWTGHATAQPAPNFDWAGPYVGASIGLNALSSPATFNYPSGGSDNITFIGNAPFYSSGIFSTSFAPWPTNPILTAPLIATFDAGMNFQSGNVVYGFEGDASYSPSGEFHQSTGDSNTTNDFSVTGGVNTLFTLRPRVGVAVDKLLLFATGGLAVGQAGFATQAHIADSGKGLASADWSGQNSAWRTGFTFGGGAEYAVTPKMRLKFEALYYDLGTIDVTANGSGISTAPASLTAQPYNGTLKLQGMIGRVGVNVGF
jgi:outer membrane immunogenic protein